MKTQKTIPIYAIRLRLDSRARFCYPWKTAQLR